MTRGHPKPLLRWSDSPHGGGEGAPGPQAPVSGPQCSCPGSMSFGSSHSILLMLFSFRSDLPLGEAGWVPHTGPRGDGRVAGATTLEASRRRSTLRAPACDAPKGGGGPGRKGAAPPGTVRLSYETSHQRLAGARHAGSVQKHECLQGCTWGQRSIVDVCLAEATTYTATNQKVFVRFRQVTFQNSKGDKR